jgi:hypothetical protein
VFVQKNLRRNFVVRGELCECAPVNCIFIYTYAYIYIYSNVKCLLFNLMLEAALTNVYVSLFYHEEGY